VDARVRRSPVADANTRAAFSDLVNQYLNRRLPWGTPWWPYAVALGVANVTRQLVKPDDLSTAADATMFVLMVVAVVAVVTFGHLVLWPQPKDSQDGDEVSLDLQDPPENVLSRAPVELHTPRSAETDPQRPRPAVARSDRWAPWWWYVVTILGVNYLRQAVMPVGTVPEWAVVLIVVAMVAALFVAVTWVYRRRSSMTEQSQPGIGRRAP
jgi:hypothetical protein